MRVVTNASPHGLGAVILQQQSSGEDQLVSFVSRAVTPVECCFSQIERETLAIYFARHQFKMYLHGITFEVYTGHKPLIALFNPNPPPRVERWLMKLMHYTFTVLYQPSNSNPADYLSRSNTYQRVIHIIMQNM